MVGWVFVGGRDLASGFKYGNSGSVYYGWLPVYKKTTAYSADQCLQACKDDNDGKCQSVIFTASKNECFLNDFGKGTPLPFVRSSSYAVVSDCGTPKANSNCFKSGEFITSPLSHGNAYSFEDCKNNCQSSNKCQVRMLLNSPSLASHCENFLFFYLFLVFFLGPSTQILWPYGIRRDMGLRWQ